MQRNVTNWLFRVALNRIIDLLRKKRPETFSDAAVEGEGGQMLHIEDLLPSPDAGRNRSTFATCFTMSCNLPSTNFPMTSATCLSPTSWKGAAQLQGDGCVDRREREYAALAQTVCSAASAGAASRPLRWQPSIVAPEKQEPQPRFL